MNSPNINRNNLFNLTKKKHIDRLLYINTATQAQTSRLKTEGAMLTLIVVLFLIAIIFGKEGTE